MVGSREQPVHNAHAQRPVAMLAVLIAQEHCCPEGVVAVCVAGLNWLSFSNRRRSLILGGKTDFAFVARKHAHDWVTPGSHIRQGGKPHHTLTYTMPTLAFKVSESTTWTDFAGLSRIWGLPLCQACLCKGTAGSCSPVLQFCVTCGISLPLLASGCLGCLIFGTWYVQIF